MLDCLIAKIKLQSFPFFPLLSLSLSISSTLALPPSSSRPAVGFWAPCLARNSVTPDCVHLPD